MSYMAAEFIRGGKPNSPEAVDTFLSGFAYGSFAAAFTPSFKFESNKAKILDNAGIASVTSVITDSLDAFGRGELPDLRKTILNGAKAFASALLLNPTMLGVIAEQGALQKGFIGTATNQLGGLLENEEFVGFVLAFLPVFSIDFALEQLENIE